MTDNEDTETDNTSSEAEAVNKHNADNTPRRGRGAMIVAVLALLVALITVAAVAALGYLGYQRAHTLGDRVATAEQTITTTTQDVILPKIDGLKSRINQLDTSLKQRGNALSRLRKDLRRTQSQLTDLTTRVMGGRRLWTLLSLEDLLLTANRQLLLEHDPKGAIQALKIVSQKLARLNDPRLFDIRKTVINDIAALKAMPDPDIQGLAIKLTALSEQVDQLPLASSVPSEFHDKDADDNATTDGIATSSWDHFVNSVTKALDGMLTIRHGSTGTITPLMPPDQAFFLRQNLKLKLQTARMALLKHNPTVYRTSLKSARDWLEQFFDTDNAAVAAAIEQINRMQSVRIDWQAPDITESLTALRAFLDKTHKSAWKSAAQAETSANQGNGDNRK